MTELSHNLKQVLMYKLLSFLISVTLLLYWGSECWKQLQYWLPVAYVNAWENIIHICQDYTVDNLVHEFWHIFYNYLTEEQQSQWHKLHYYNVTWPLKNRGFVSFYASFDEYEDFAETFLYIFKKWEDTPKSIFIKNIILNFN